VISVEEAYDRLLRAVAPLPPVDVDLLEAAGRVLAEEVLADRDAPAAARSAMDGFAVQAEDLRTPPAVLRVVGEVRAGEPAPSRPLAGGEAMRVFTGALVPAGADAVVMVEVTEEDLSAGTVRVMRAAHPGQHVRARGEERRRRDPVLLAGSPLHAGEVASLAALGRARVRVHRPPVVHLLSTGDEVVPIESVPADHQVRNSNAWGLRAQLRDLRLVPVDLGIAPDRPEGLRQALRQGLQGDVLLVTGGVSVGDYDLVARSLAEEGLEVLFHGVKMRPGKPLLAGRRGNCLVFGLPGNPLSTFATFLLFVAPALRRLMGFAGCAPPRVPVTLRGDLERKPDRTTFHLARVTAGERGLVAEPLPSTGSGDVLSLPRANAFVVTEPGTGAVPAGSALPAVLWPEFAHR
jgi:molybdopterin molybdotransferase